MQVLYLVSFLGLYQLAVLRSDAAPCQSIYVSPFTLLKRGSGLLLGLVGFIYLKKNTGIRRTKKYESLFSVCYLVKDQSHQEVQQI